MVPNYLKGDVEQGRSCATRWLLLGHDCWFWRRTWCRWFGWCCRRGRKQVSWDGVRDWIPVHRFRGALWLLMQVDWGNWGWEVITICFSFLCEYEIQSSAKSQRSREWWRLDKREFTRELLLLAGLFLLDRGCSLDAIFLKKPFLSCIVIRSCIVALNTLCCPCVYLPVFPFTTSWVRVWVQS